MSGLISLALSIVAFTGQASSSTNLERDFETALGNVGLNVRTARFDESLLTLFRQGEFATPWYTVLSANPWRMPYLGEVTRGDLLGTADRPSDSVNVVARLAGFGTRRTLVGNPIEASVTFSKGRNALGKILEEYDKQKLLTIPIPLLGQVPDGVNSAAALVLHAVLKARDLRRVGLSGLGELSAHYATVSGKPDDEDPLAFDAMYRRYLGTNLPALVAAGHDVLLAAQEAATLLASVPGNLKYDVAISTTMGNIRLTGGGPTKHTGEHLLIIDTGGNDVYVNAPSTLSAANGFSLCIDASGDDKYVSDEALTDQVLEKWPGRKAPSNRPGPGGSLFGATALLDLAGNDLYRTHRPGLGSARFGVAALLDRAGDDVYDAYQDSEGFGMFGVGVLEDSSGNDLYSGFTQVQGVGQTAGAGLLIDRLGKDVYTANESTIDFPSPQSKDHNVSMAQGAGNGRRADYLDGKSLAGGIGILYDIAGDDRYSCGVFGQGVGYWMGVGALWDGDGSDEYKGQWYIQGASAHFAIGMLDDLAGNDRYLAPMNMAQGAGHDFSIGLLLDRSGDDLYKAPNLSLGAGNANGIGIFVDVAGADQYESSGLTLGRAAEAAKASLRSRALCLGLFMDMEGQDAYPAQASWAKNSNRAVNWTDRLTTAAESQVGVFWDR